MAIEAQLSSIRADGKHVAIHTLDVHGRFITRRRLVFALLAAVYAGAPLISVGGHPAVHLDVAARRFYLFGGTFNAQDFWLVLLLTMALVFALLFVTAWRGRLWCGWACPQTVFLEGLFRPIERLIDGPRNVRMKRASAPIGPGRLARVALKHTLYLVAAAAIAHVALAFFLSAADLVGMVREGPAAHPTAFVWATAVTAALYFDFAFFREQLCVVLCPYGRLQSVMHDQDSIVVGYDARRGEPRGPVRKSLKILDQRGACVDCKKCVWACPTGIDIRDGLQMECVACAQCIDVCDGVMDKLGRARGLIRYASTNELEGKPHRVLRPRLVLYAALALLAGGLFTYAVAARTPFEANLLRTPGVPWVLEGGRVRNQLELHLVNKNPTTARFRIEVSCPVPAELRLGQQSLALPSLGGARIPLVVTVERAHLRPGLAVEVRITDEASGASRVRLADVMAPGQHAR